MATIELNGHAINNELYRCLNGDKISLPGSALRHFGERNEPVTCRVTSFCGRHVYGQIANYVAEEGTIKLPEWMLSRLRVNDGSRLNIAEIKPPAGTSITLSALPSVLPDDLRDPATFYNSVLYRFSCVAVGQNIYFKDSHRQKYTVRVVQTLPGPIVRINSQTKIEFEETRSEVPSTNTAESVSSASSLSDSDDSDSLLDVSHIPNYPSPTEALSAQQQKKFSENFCVYSVDKLTIAPYPPNIEKGNKIVLPSALLFHISTKGLHRSKSHPMVFKIENRHQKRSTHCGVLQFSAHCGTCHIPEWLMRQLRVANGDTLTITLIDEVALGVYAKLQPDSNEFMEKTDHRGILEQAFQNFTCISQNDTIAIHDDYGNRTLLRVLETQPKSTIAITDCELNIDVIPPKGYTKGISSAEQLAKDFAQPEVVIDEAHGGRRYEQRGVPDFRYNPEKIQLKFIRMRPNIV